MVEMRLHLFGVGVTTLTHKIQNLLSAHLHRGVPGVPGPRRPARMKQGQSLARQETVVDEEALFDRQARVAALQLTGAIVLHAVRENQILGSCGRAHRVGLDKAQARNGSPQAGGLEKAPRDCVAAKLLEAGGFGRAHAWCPVRALGFFAPTSRGAVRDRKLGRKKSFLTFSLVIRASANTGRLSSPAPRCFLKGKAISNPARDTAPIAGATPPVSIFGSSKSRLV